MEQLVVGLILTMLTGLTYLAYKHPNAYQKLFSWIFISLLLIVIALHVWNVAIGKSFVSIISYIESTQLEAASSVNEKMFVPSMYIWGLVLLQFYLGGILYLHMLLKEGKEKSYIGN